MKDNLNINDMDDNVTSFVVCPMCFFQGKDYIHEVPNTEPWFSCPNKERD